MPFCKAYPQYNLTHTDVQHDAGRHRLLGPGVVMNCSFNNPKSSRFFLRLHDEEERNDDLDCMGIQEDGIVVGAV